MVLVDEFRMTMGGEVVVAEAGEVHVCSYVLGVPGKVVGHASAVVHEAER